MKAKVIWGPPASGKSTYVTNNMGKNDIVYDYDRLMQELGRVEAHQHNKPIGKYLWQIRELLIRNIKSETKLDTFWCIITWVDDEFKQKFEGYTSVDYVLMDTTEEECINRIKNNDDRTATQEEQIQVVKEWFKKYKEANKRSEIRKELKQMGL